MALHVPHPSRVRHFSEVLGEKAHLVYFGAVFMEGHGWYASAAGVCLALGLLYEGGGVAALLEGLFGGAAVAAEVVAEGEVE